MSLAFVAYLCGLCAGTGLGFLFKLEYQRYNVRVILKNLKKELIIAYDEGVKFGAVKLQLQRINEISKIQMDFMGALDRPNASAAHARHKNSIVSQVKALEEEKVTIFKSILKEGADPMLSVVINGETKSLRASELLPILEGKDELPADTTPQTKTDSNSSVSAKTKLHVVKLTQENTDDGSKSNPGDPAVH